MPRFPSVMAGCLLLCGAPWTLAGTDGYDTRPEGPMIAEVEAAGRDGAVVNSVAGSNQFEIAFPPSDARPAAVFSFPKVDINDRAGVALDIRNEGDEPVRVFADLSGDTWVRGYVTATPGETISLFVFARRKKHSAADLARFPGMHGIPGGKMSLWARIEEPILANKITVFVVAPRSDVKILVDNLRPFGSNKAPDEADFFPFIDRYGQYKHKQWPGKVNSDADLPAAKETEDADLAAHPGPQDRNQYGGWTGGPQLEATGRFRVEKYRDKWWLVDPEGRLFWSNGLNMVGFFWSSTNTRGREKFFEEPEGNLLERNLEIKYGRDWPALARDRIQRRMTSWGLNTIGTLSDRRIVEGHRLPYVVQLYSRFDRVGGPTTEAFARQVRESLEQAAKTYGADPWCIGFFVDNEIHPNHDPAWFEAYYRVVGTAAKEIMPDTLYLGSRLDFHDWPDDPPGRFGIVRAAAKYCDVVSFNFYKFTLDDVVMPEGVDKPVIIGEFHMGALDRGPFHTGLRSVLDQEQRAEAYRYYVGSALRNRAIVGTHWFQCYDQSIAGRFDGENYQIGFLDICDTPYWETIAAAREMGEKMYAIRAAE